MNLAVETEQETDGRWIAEIPQIPGALAYGSDRREAISRVEALALRVFADRLEHTKDVSRTPRCPFIGMLITAFLTYCLIGLSGCGKNDSSARNTEIQQLQERISDLESRLNESRNSAQRTESEAKQLNKRIAEVSQQNGILSQQLEDSKSAIRKTKEQQDKFLQSEGIVEVKQLKLYEFAKSAHIDFQLTNKSSYFFDYWQIDADVHAANGVYLGHGFANGGNVRPGQSLTAKISFTDVDVSNVAIWKPAVGRIVIGLPGGKIELATERFTLKEIK